jgi:hypothetical protein
MSGTTKCPRVRRASPVANIYCHELAMRVFNNQLKVTEIEIESYLSPAVPRSQIIVQLRGNGVPDPPHCRGRIINTNATLGM